MKLTTHLHLALGLKIHGVVLPLPHMSSWCVMLSISLWHGTKLSTGTTLLYLTLHYLTFTTSSMQCIAWSILYQTECSFVFCAV